MKKMFMFFIAVSCLFTVTAFSFTPKPEQKPKTFETELVADNAVISIEMQSVNLLFKNDYQNLIKNKNSVNELKNLDSEDFLNLSIVKNLDNYNSNFRKITLQKYNKPALSFFTKILDFQKM